MTDMYHRNAKFPQHLLALSLNERRAYFRNGFVLNHESLALAVDRVFSLIDPSSDDSVIKVVGPTGAGKSVLCREVAKALVQRYESEGVLPPHPLVVHEISSALHSNMDWKDFFIDLHEAIHAPDPRLLRGIAGVGYPRQGRVYTTRRMSAAELRTEFIKRLREYRIRVLIFDEAEYLFKYNAATADKMMNALMSIASKAECQIVLVGTYDGLSEMDYSGPLNRRVADVHFPNYAWGDSNEQRAFISAYSGLLAHVPFELEDNLLDESCVQWAYLASCGCIGILRDLIYSAVNKLPRDGVLTVSNLKQNQKNSRKLRQIAEEIAEGREYFESGGELEALEGLLGVSGQSNVAKHQKPKSRTAQRRPGQRNPKRDPVGV